MSFTKGFVQVTLATALAITLPLGLVGCGGAKSDATDTSVSSSKSESLSSGDQSMEDLADVERLSANLRSTFEYQGVSIEVDPTWSTNTYADYGRIMPNSFSMITVRAYSNGETASIEAYAEKGSGVLYDIADYTQDSSWEIEGGTKAASYTLNHDGRLYSFVMGHNETTNKGFVIFFNRGSEDKPSSIGDGTYEKMIKSIAFDPSAVSGESTADNSSEKNTGNQSSSSIGPGTYKVGTDIPAGEYKLTATSNKKGYWEVTNSSAADADIVGNDNFTGSTYVTVTDGQYLKLKRCTAEPTS